MAIELRKRRNCLPITFSCPLDLLDLLDDSSAKENKSRSEVIVEILKERFKTES